MYLTAAYGRRIDKPNFTAGNRKPLPILQKEGFNLMDPGGMHRLRVASPRTMGVLESCSCAACRFPAVLPFVEPQQRFSPVQPHPERKVLKIKNPRFVRNAGLVFGGAKRDRTADLNTASVALSQLSYSPKMLLGLRPEAGRIVSLRFGLSRQNVAHNAFLIWWEIKQLPYSLAAICSPPRSGIDTPRR